MKYLLAKLKSKDVWDRILYERLAEPLHLNLAALWVAVFGSFRRKVAFDLVVRQHNAYGILKAADRAKRLGVEGLSIIEFGVAAGAGLMNMANLARKVTAVTGVQIDVYGFDTGRGMPPARDYRDHPDLYQEGDFPMDFERLSKALPGNSRLFIGDTTANLKRFLETLSPQFPVGYVVVDVDYYSSTAEVLKVFEDDPRKYLPTTLVFLDDIWLDENNSFCGELLAVQEFNRDHPHRKIEHHPFLEKKRIFRRAQWVRQMYQLHMLDHPTRFSPTPQPGVRRHRNAYLE